MAWPRAHTYASENADLYRAQDHAVSRVITAIRNAAAQESEG
jgi:tRNA threonylcarbamoyladenosine modification (KEOPS) complex Cgi121 subunit